MGQKNESGESRLALVIDRARDHLARALEELDREAGAGREEAIHEIRKRFKKARACILLTRGPIRRKEIEKADRRLRDASRPLSAVRDAFALIRTFDDLADTHDGHGLPEVIAEVRVALEAHRDELERERLLENESFAAPTKAIRSIRRRLAKWDDSSDQDLDYRRAYRRARDLSRAAVDDPSPETLHELRKRVKVLENQLATIEAESGGPIARIQRLVGLLADELGRVHDLDNLREFLAGADESSPLMAVIDRRRLGLRHDALRRAGVVFLDKPRVFGKMIAMQANVEVVATGS